MLPSPSSLARRVTPTPSCDFGVCIIIVSQHVKIPGGHNCVVAQQTGTADRALMHRLSTRSLGLGAVCSVRHSRATDIPLPVHRIGVKLKFAG